jgi:hypothetical protein
MANEKSIDDLFLQPYIEKPLSRKVMPMFFFCFMGDYPLDSEQQVLSYIPRKSEWLTNLFYFKNICTTVNPSEHWG